MGGSSIYTKLTFHNYVNLKKIPQIDKLHVGFDHVRDLIFGGQFGREVEEERPAKTSYQGSLTLYGGDKNTRSKVGRLKMNDVRLCFCCVVVRAGTDKPHRGG